MAGAKESAHDAAQIGFVLLPPAFLGKWIWDDVVPHLAGPALALDMPGSATPTTRKAYTLDAGVVEVARRIKEWGHGKVVLVGHSLGGQIASGVACRFPELLHKVVFISAPLLEQGQAQLTLHPPLLRLFLRATSRLQPSGGLPPAGALRKVYCNDLDEATTKAVLEKAEPYPPRFHMDPVTWDVRETGVPALYVRLLRDQSVLTPAMQDRLIAMLPKAQVVTLDAGHAPMLSQPKELAAALNRALV